MYIKKKKKKIQQQQQQLLGHYAVPTATLHLLQLILVHDHISRDL